MIKQWIRLATIITMVYLMATAFSCIGPPPTTPRASTFTPSLAPTPALTPTRLPTPTPALSLASTPVPARPRSTSELISNIYIGSLHSAHTLYSDGQLEYPGEFYSTFKPYWDWISTADHDNFITSETWQSTIENANAYNSKNFVSFIGFEWTSYYWGHLSVVFKGKSPPNLLVPAISSKPAYDSPRKLYAFLSAANGLAVFAHPASLRFPIHFNRVSDYRDDAVAPLVAMFGFRNRSHWNKSWDYDDSRSTPAENADILNAVGLIKRALDLGYRLGFVGELDLHQKAIDPKSYRYTGVVADSLTRESIFEALKKRHTYAVKSPSGLGKRIWLRADAGNHLMGDIFANESNVIKVTLQGKTDLAQFSLINLFVNGKITQSRAVSGRDLDENFNVDLTDENNYTFFEVKALSADGQVSQAFTSPMYVTICIFRSKTAGSSEQSGHPPPR